MSRASQKKLTAEIFTIWSNEVMDRIDPYFYLPKFKELYKRINSYKKVVRLKDIIDELDYGLMPTQDYAENETGGVPMIRVTNISQDGTIDMSDTQYIPFDTPRLDVKRVKENDVLMVQCGSTTGKVALVPKELENYTFGSFSFVIRGKNDLVTQEYLFAILMSPLVQEQIRQTWNVVTVRPNTSKPNVENLLIPLPSLTEQRKIGQKLLEAYEQKKKKEKEILKILSSIDDFVLGELGIDMPEGGAERVFQIWSDEIENRIDALFYKPYLRSLLEQIKNKKHFALGEAIADMSGGATPKVTGDYYSGESGVPFLRVQNITEMGIKLDDVKFIKPEIHETMLKRSQLKKDDLVFTITGRIGSVAVVPDNFEGNINQHSVRFHLQKEVGKTKVLPEYVASFFNTKIGRELSFRSTTGGTRPALDYDALKKLVVPLPSVEKQAKIISGVKTIYEKAKRLRQESESIVAGAQKEIEQMILV